MFLHASGISMTCQKQSNWEEKIEHINNMLLLIKHGKENLIIPLCCVVVVLHKKTKHKRCMRCTSFDHFSIERKKWTEKQPEFLFYFQQNEETKCNESHIIIFYKYYIHMGETERDRESIWTLIWEYSRKKAGPLCAVIWCDMFLHPHWVFQFS